MPFPLVLLLVWLPVLISPVRAWSQTWTMHGTTTNFDTNGWGNNPSVATDTNGDIWVASVQERKPDLFDSNGQYSSKISVSKWNGTTMATVGNPIGRITTDGSTYAVSWAASIETIGTTAYVAHYEANGFGTDGSNESSVFVHQWNGSSWVQLDGTRSNGSVSSGDGTIESTQPALRNVGGVLYLATIEEKSGYHQVAVFHWTGSAWVQDGVTFADSALAGTIMTNVSLANVNGVPHVAWRENRRTGSAPSLRTNTSGVVKVRKLDAGSWVAVGSDIDNGGNANFVTLTAIGATPYIAWSEKTATGNIRLYGRTFNGTSWVNLAAGATLNFDVTDGDVGKPSLVSDGTDLWLVWAEWEIAQTSRIYARKYTVSSNTWGSIEGPINQNISTTSASSVVATVKSGIPYVAFRSVHPVSNTSHIFLFGRNGTGTGTPPSLSAWGSNGGATAPIVGSWVTRSPGGVIGSGGVGINAEFFSTFRCLPNLDKCVFFEKYHTIPNGSSGESQTALLGYNIVSDRWDLMDVSEAAWSEHLPGAGHDQGQMSIINTNQLFIMGNAVLMSDLNRYHTYIYDLQARHGKRMYPQSELPNTSEGAFSYDPSRNQVFASGGNTTTSFMYSGATNQWSTKALGPQRGWPCMVYAPAPIDKHILFGGKVGGIDSAEVWVYDTNGNSWAQKTPSGGPAGRYSPYCSWDSVVGKMVMTGGGSSETWTYDPDDGAQGTWAQIANAPAGVASLSRGHWMDYDSKNNMHILVGGSNLTSVHVLRLQNVTPPTLPIGTLIHDGPATPEQLSLLLPVTDTPALPTTATASVNYKVTGAGSWTTGHNLLRIRPDLVTNGTEATTVIDAFAWPIIGLSPGTSYDVEVTVTSGLNSEVRTGTFVTRALPSAAGAANKTIAAGSTTSQIQTTLNGLVAGDVLQIDTATYTLNAELTISVAGTQGSPIYIRGQSRTGTVLHLPTAGRVLFLTSAGHIIFENLTIRGTQVDSGTSANSSCISFSNTGTPQTRITVRNVICEGIDQGIVATGPIQEALIYNNTLTGNNSWTQDFYAHGGSGAPGAGDGTLDLDQNLFWNDDGLRLPGYGNVGFQNTLYGFGDALSVCSHSGETASAECRAIHFYRNDIKMTGDDGTEADHAFRNVSFYDNRFHNSMTSISLDPIYGGPYLAARNIFINVGRSPYKFNNINSGHFIYNNTVVRTTGNTSGWGWLQPSNGAQRNWGYRNNVFIYQVPADKLMAMESTGNDPIDWTHNSWYPNKDVWWTNSGSSYANIAAAYAALAATTPVFSGQTKRHEQDTIAEADPFAADVILGADYHTELVSFYTPTLSSGSVPDATGVAIANITDGFTGGAPDRGALISGITNPTWGDQTLTVSVRPPSIGGNLSVSGGAQVQ